MNLNQFEISDGMHRRFIIPTASINYPRMKLLFELPDNFNPNQLKKIQKFLKTVDLTQKLSLTKLTYEHSLFKVVTIFLRMVSGYTVFHTYVDSEPLKKSIKSSKKKITY